MIYDVLLVQFSGRMVLFPNLLSRLLTIRFVITSLKKYRLFIGSHEDIIEPYIPDLKKRIV